MSRVMTAVAFVIALSNHNLFAGLIASVSVTGQDDIRVVQIAPTPLGEDAVAFTDRNHEWNALPSEIPQLTGAEYIMTGNDNRDDPNLQITVTLSQRATLWLFLDTRIPGDGVTADTPLPWMTDLGFVDSGYDIGLDSHDNGTIETYHSIYGATFDAGDVVFLSENYQGVAQYGIAATTPVPEPSSITLFALCTVGIVVTARRKKKT